MARALRIEYAGAVYHLMARGNQGHAIFQEDRATAALYWRPWGKLARKPAGQFTFTC